MDAYASKLVINILVLSFLILLIDGKECDYNDLVSTFTECDQLGGRWQVLVPKNLLNCTMNYQNLSHDVSPKRLEECFNSCDPGYYFNTTLLSCQPCQAGYFSLGQGRFFGPFTDEMLKKDFQLKSEALDDEGKKSDAGSNSCPQWKISELDQSLKLDIDYYKSIRSQNCIMSLKHGVNLVKSGYIKFTYQYDDSASKSLFEFNYKTHSNNHSDDDIESNTFHKIIRSSFASQKELWRTERINLKDPGFHIFNWKLSILGIDFHDRPIQMSDSFGPPCAHLTIKSVEIHGIENTAGCSPCGKGTYNNQSASYHCLPCPHSTSNNKVGQQHCQMCNLETEFSNLGFVECLPKPPCGANDYHLVYGPCILSNNTQLVRYAWIHPKICIGDSLPAERYEACHMHMANSSIKAHMTQKIDSTIDLYDKDNKPVSRHSIWSGDRICNPGLGMAVAITRNNTQYPLVASSMKELVKKLSALLYRADIGNSLDLSDMIDYDEPKSMADLQHFCDFCPSGTYNDGYDLNCLECPANKLPVYQFSLMSWSKNTKDIKEYITSRSLGIGHGSSYEDKDNLAWIIPDESDSYIRTSPSALLGTYSILTISLPGFRSASGGNVSFKFELDCGSGDSCLLAYFINLKNQEDYPIRFWTESTNGITSFSHSIEINLPFSLSWAFRRQTSYQSSVRIYEVNVTNSKIGGAVKCESCLTQIIKDVDTKTCLKCPPGHYYSSAIEANSQLKTGCILCPSNTIAAVDRDSFMNDDIVSDMTATCKKCEYNLIPNNDQTKCIGNCSFKLGNETFDLNFNSKQLTNIHSPENESKGEKELLMKTKSLFSLDGKQYYHEFRLSLCGHKGNAMCNNTILYVDDSQSEDQDDFIRSFVCRSTIMPGSKEMLRTQSISLGDQIDAILEEGDMFDGLGIHPDFLLAAQLERETSNSKLQLISFHYSTKNPTTTCPKGMKTILTLRCSRISYLKKGIFLKNGEYELSNPTSCNYGTCDGCNYHFMLTSVNSLTCRQCRNSDFTEIVGECINDKQTVHYINPVNCATGFLDSNKNLTVTNTRDCVSPTSTKTIIMSILILLLSILIINVFVVIRIKKKIQYKYSKLNNREFDKPSNDSFSLGEVSSNASNIDFLPSRDNNSGINTEEFVDIDINQGIDTSFSSSKARRHQKQQRDFENIQLSNTGGNKFLPFS